MKITLKNLLLKLDKNDLNKLTEQVKETICVDVETSVNNRRFTPAELARIQGRKRMILVGRRYF